MLPVVFDAFVDGIERVHYTDAERKAWLEKKNTQLLESLRGWANLYVDSITASNIFGSLLDYSGQMQEALACYQRMAEVSKELGDLDALGAAFNNKGNVYK